MQGMFVSNSTKASAWYISLRADIICLYSCEPISTSTKKEGNIFYLGLCPIAHYKTTNLRLILLSYNRNDEWAT